MLPSLLIRKTLRNFKTQTFPVVSGPAAIGIKFQELRNSYNHTYTCSIASQLSLTYGHNPKVVRLQERAVGP